MSKGIPEGVIAPHWAADLDLDWDEILSRPRLSGAELAAMMVGFYPVTDRIIGTDDIVYRRP